MGDLACPAPWLRPHYRAFIATTSWSASVPRIGTLTHVALTTGFSLLTTRVPTAPLQPVVRIEATDSPVPCQGLQRAHATFTPDTTRATSRQLPGSGHAERRALVPRRDSGPGFDVVVHIFDASAVVYTCSSSRRSPDPLVAGLLRSRFPPRLLTGMTLRWFGISACTANPEGLPPSLAQHGSCCRSSTSSSLPFQDTPRPQVPVGGSRPSATACSLASSMADAGLPPAPPGSGECGVLGSPPAWHPQPSR